MRVSLSLFSRVLSVTESNAAREWIQQFKLKGGLTPPKHADDYEFSYSRSSGPGGQNVNKVNTKATIRLDLGRAKRWLPEHAVEELRDSVCVIVDETHALMNKLTTMNRTYSQSMLKAATLSFCHPCAIAHKRRTPRIVYKSEYHTA
jgi:hypothetical protein